MAEKHSKHDASIYRGIIREAKSGYGKSINKLVLDARNLKDPYYVSLALFDLSCNPRFGLGKASTISIDALKAADRVDRLWRRAEVLVKISKKTASWRDEKNIAEREKILDGVLYSIVAFPVGKGLSDAISGCAPHIGCTRLKLLLKKAVSNSGFESGNSKKVIREWAILCKDGDFTLDEITDILGLIDDTIIRSRLLGYTHIQCREYSLKEEAITTLKAALETALKIENEERIEVLRYLAGICSSEDDLTIFEKSLKRIEDPEDRSRIMATLGGSADKAGLKARALGLFKEGLEISSEVLDPGRRAAIRLNLASGMGRCGESELAHETYIMALEDSKGNTKLVSRICSSMEKQGLEPPKDIIKPNKEQKVEKGIKKPSENVEGTRNILALYDTYEGGIKPVHIRAVARAAPLCKAFGLNLALMGFPTDDLDGLVSLVVKDTMVGRGGKYLNELIGQKRVLLVSCDKNNPPDRKSTRLNSSHIPLSRMPSSA